MNGKTPRFSWRSCYRPVVLVVLLLACLQQTPAIEGLVGLLFSDVAPSIECADCCGSNCQCTSGCCSDSHVVTDKPRPQRLDGPVVSSSSTVLKRQNDCRGGAVVTTTFATYQPFLEPDGRVHVEPATRLAHNPGINICRWSRPAASRNSPRAPPAALAC